MCQLCDVVEGKKKPVKTLNESERKMKRFNLWKDFNNGKRVIF